VAETGQEALERLRAAKASGAPYKLLLSDMHMPEMDGFTLAEAVGADPELKSVKVIVLTSGGQRGDGARCRELGIAGYLTKPVRRGELRAAITSVIQSANADEPRSPVTRHSVRQAKKKHARILVAEDNAVNQRVVKRIIERQGYEPIVVNNGREAIEALAQTEFDIVLMDVQMPEMDGFEATAQVRLGELRTGKHQYIVAMTAHAMSGDRERCLKAGMDGYLAKPISTKELADVLEQVDAAILER
jgi:CheY-like chemotaxis protein